MAVEVRLPQWGMNMQEGTLVEWLKHEGERVDRGESLATIEAAKAVEAVESPTSGILMSIHVREGETVPVRAVLCTIQEADKQKEQSHATLPVRSDLAQGEVSRSIPSCPEPHVLRATPVARRLAKILNIDLDRIEGSGPAGRIIKSDVQRAAEDTETKPRLGCVVQVEPRARRLAKGHALDLGAVRGTGPRGRITEEDVQRTIQASDSIPETFKIVSLTGMRGSIAQNMRTSLQTMAQLTLFSDVDVTSLVAQRDELKAKLNITYTPIIVKAVAMALEEHSRLNAIVEGEQIRVMQGIHVGVAVALEDGLIVPVVRDANQKTVQQINREIEDLAVRARMARLSPSEVVGGTFTITNLGPLGVDSFTPIINPPEVAILGVGRIREQLARRGDALLWRNITTLSLTFDHRAVDGAPAAAFVKGIAGRLENPDWLS